MMMYDTEMDECVNAPHPFLNEARMNHSSCATDSAAFVYGGFGGSARLDTIEWIPIESKRDWLS